MKSLSYLSVALLFLLLAGVGSAATPKSGSDQWITPPDTFLQARLVRAASTPAKTYETILDLPPGKSGDPTISRSCGDPDIDKVAADFVKSAVARGKDLRELGRHKELRFQMRLIPMLFEQPKLTTPANAAGSIYTPKPAYPYAARMNGQSGAATVRVKFVHGRASLVVVVKSTGSQILDTNSALYVLTNWTATGSAADSTVSIPITYLLGGVPMDRTGTHAGFDTPISVFHQ